MSFQETYQFLLQPGPGLCRSRAILPGFNGRCLVHTEILASEMKSGRKFLASVLGCGRLSNDVYRGVFIIFMHPRWFAQISAPAKSVIVIFVVQGFFSQWHNGYPSKLVHLVGGSACISKAVPVKCKILRMVN